MKISATLLFSTCNLASLSAVDAALRRGDTGIAALRRTQNLDARRQLPGKSKAGGDAEHEKSTGKGKGKGKGGGGSKKSSKGSKTKKSSKGASEEVAADLSVSAFQKSGLQDKAFVELFEDGTAFGESPSNLCRPAKCLDLPAEESCAAGIDFQGGDCNTTPGDPDQCGEQCPPGSCECDGPGENCRCDLMPELGELVLTQREREIDCMKVGTAVVPSGINRTEYPVGSGVGVPGATYTYAITCQRILTGGQPENNLDVGQYSCSAVRSGAGLTGLNAGVGGVVSFAVPCALVQGAECGCGPDDLRTFDFFDQPTQTCQAAETPGTFECPFLCEDAFESHRAEGLCNNFSIEWFLGQNALAGGLDLFALSTPSDPAEIEINIY